MSARRSCAYDAIPTPRPPAGQPEQETGDPAASADLRRIAAQGARPPPELPATSMSRHRDLTVAPLVEGPIEGARAPSRELPGYFPAPA
jgi:hypothetical protein